MCWKLDKKRCANGPYSWLIRRCMTGLQFFRDETTGKECLGFTTQDTRFPNAHCEALHNLCCNAAKQLNQTQATSKYQSQPLATSRNGPTINPPGSATCPHQTCGCVGGAPCPHETCSGGGGANCFHLVFGLSNGYAP